LAIAYVLSQFYRSFLAVLTPQLSSELGADKNDLSLASGVWFMSFALMQFVVGIGLDRYGPRRTGALIFGFGTTSGALLFATAQSPGAIVLAMLLIGIGCSPVLMASLFIFAQRFKAGTFAVMTSSLVAFGNTGNVIGASPLATAVDAFGWREVMFALGLASMLISLAIFVLVEDPQTKASDTDGISGYLTLLKLPALWTIMGMTLLCYAPVASIRGLWAGPYLHDLYQANSLVIGQVTLYMAIAMIVGCGTSYGVLMAHGRAFLPSHLVGRGVTLLNFCSIFGAGLVQFASGRAISSRADPSSAQSYQVLFSVYAVLLLITLAGYLFSKDAPPGQENASALGK